MDNLKEALEIYAQERKKLNKHQSPEKFKKDMLTRVLKIKKTKIKENKNAK